MVASTVPISTRPKRTARLNAYPITRAFVATGEYNVATTPNARVGGFESHPRYMTIPIGITDADASAMQRALDAETRALGHLEIEIHPYFVDPNVERLQWVSHNRMWDRPWTEAELRHDHSCSPCIEGQ